MNFTPTRIICQTTWNTFLVVTFVFILPCFAALPFKLTVANAQTVDSVHPQPPSDAQPVVLHSVLVQPEQEFSPAASQAAYVPPTDQVEPDRLSQSSITQLQELITSIAREHIPGDYQDDNKWGEQAERFDGLKFERDGLRIETRARRKMVNHGRWTRYKASLSDPEKNLTIRIEEIRRREDDMIVFRVLFLAKIDLQGEVAKWVKGVKIYSFSADAVADVGLRVECVLDTSLDFSRLPPDLVFRPQVNAAELVIVDFNLIRIGQAGGELADQLGRAVKDRLQEEVDRKAHKLVTKANAAIEKKQDKLRLSAADLLESQWSDWADRFLPSQTAEKLKTNAVGK